MNLFDSFAEDPVMVVATLRLDVALAGGVVERPLTTEPALLAAHVCKAGALFGVAEGELVSNGAGRGLPPVAVRPIPTGKPPRRGVQSLTSLISNFINAEEGGDTPAKRLR